MVKFLRFAKAQSNHVYMEIADYAVERLIANGFFIRDEVLERTGYDAGFDIRWDYVRRIIEEKHDTELIPLGPRFLSRHQLQDEQQFTERFIAGGNGRKCVAYANATQKNGHFILMRLKVKGRIADGLAKSVQRTVAIAQKVGVPLPKATQPTQIEDNSKKKKKQT